MGLLAFLLVLLILAQFKFIRTVVGLFIWLLVACWAYGHYFPPKESIASPEPRTVEQIWNDAVERHKPAAASNLEPVQIYKPVEAIAPAAPAPTERKPAKPYVQR
jgi:hypothetical protein